MPIVVFENRHRATLILKIEPGRDEHEVPPLAFAGVRYALKKGAEDRCYAVMADGEVAFWCNADSYEVDIVRPSLFERLSYDICVNGGWCGGIVNGEPTHVYDLLPETGPITGREFAELAMRADGWPEETPFEEKHLRWLEGRFIEHVGSNSVNAEELREHTARPFGDTVS